jgi:chemotaxis signal transduction protein
MGNSAQTKHEPLPFTQALKIVLGERHYALRSSEVGRVLPMCAWTPLYSPESPSALLPLALLEVAGVLLPVVDPRPRLGLSGAEIELEQHLLLVQATPAFVLWVDRVEEVFEVSSEHIQRLEVFEGSSVRFLVRYGDETLPVLECAHFSPGEFVRPV